MNWLKRLWFVLGIAIWAVMRLVNHLVFGGTFFASSPWFLDQASCPGPRDKLHCCMTRQWAQKALKCFLSLLPAWAAMAAWRERAQKALCLLTFLRRSSELTDVALWQREPEVNDSFQSSLARAAAVSTMGSEWCWSRLTEASHTHKPNKPWTGLVNWKVCGSFWDLRNHEPSFSWFILILNYAISSIYIQMDPQLQMKFTPNVV